MNPEVKKNKKNKPFVQKNKPLPLKPVDEVKDLFRHYFKRNSKVGHTMSPADVKLNILKKLTPKEDAVFADAMRSLIKDGFITVEEDGVTIVLTKKGSDSFS